MIKLEASGFSKTVYQACFIVGLGLLTACGGSSATKSKPNQDEKATFNTRLELAEAAIEGGDLKTAIKVYSSLSEEFPGNAEILINLGNSYLEAERLDAAGPAFMKALVIEPENLGPVLGLARLEIRKLKPVDALPLFDRILEKKPDHYAALNGKGVALDLSGRHEEAQSFYHQAINLQPERIEAKVNLGLSLISTGELESAIEQLIGLARLPGMPGEVRHNLALAYALNGDIAASKEILQLDMTDGKLVENLCYYDYLRRNAGKPLDRGHPANTNCRFRQAG